MAKSETNKQLLPAETAQNLLFPANVDPAEPAVINKASALLRPLLRDPEQASSVAIQMVAEVRTHSGPLPSPDMLLGYERTLPGAADQIMKMAIREQEHRHFCERAERRYPYYGMHAGLLGLLSCIAGAVFLGAQGQPTVAIALVGAPVLAGVGWFVNGRLQPSRTAEPAPTQANERRRR